MPYTIEEEFDQTRIVIMDESGDDLDVDLIFENAGNYEGFVSLRQYNNNLNSYEVITMTPSMFKDLIKSVDSPEGFHGLLWK
tara:strand:- start:2096 stop:2341 length:246 start_codon:yes stop_codon:yes gene_type:complete